MISDTQEYLRTHVRACTFTHRDTRNTWYTFWLLSERLSELYSRSDSIFHVDIYTIELYVYICILPRLRARLVKREQLCARSMSPIDLPECTRYTAGVPVDFITRRDFDEKLTRRKSEMSRQNSAASAAWERAGGLFAILAGGFC